MYSNVESLMLHLLFSTKEKFKISLKVKCFFLSKFNWRKVSKYTNFKLGISVFSRAWNSSLLAQSRITFWQNRDFPIPAFPTTRIELALSWSSIMPRNISLECLTGVPLTFLSCSSSLLLEYVLSFLKRAFLPCCMRRLVNISSVFVLGIVREASSLGWNSVWLIIDACKYFV